MVAVPLQATWFYLMSSVPENWYASSTAGWKSAVAGQFGTPVTTVELYKTRFTVTEAELAQRSPFLMLAEEVPEAREHMGRFALAMAQQSDGSRVLLATERNLLTLNRASAEEIQDHRCAILNANH